MGTRQIQDSQSTNYPPPWEHITAVPARADRALFWGRSSANWTMQ
jgi:hypothetical protein